MDLQHSPNILSYCVAVITVSVFFYHKPRHSIVIHLMALAYMLVLYFCFVPSPALGPCLNMAIATLISNFMAISRYYTGYQNFYARQTILKQNEEIKAINEKLQKMVVTDPLTGLYNRRFLEEHIAKNWDTWAKETAVFMLDIDDFKLYNDRYGHLAGDGCLHRLSQTLLQGQDRKGDFYVIRYGGEEFLITYFDVSREKALEIGRTLCQISSQVSDGEQSLPPITISVGISHQAQTSHTLEELISQADHALYLAKAQGKNQAILL